MIKTNAMWVGALAMFGTTLPMQEGDSHLIPIDSAPTTIENP